MIDLLFGVYHCGRAAVNVKSHKIGRCISEIFLPLSGGTTKKRGIYPRERLFVGGNIRPRSAVRKEKRREGTADVPSLSGGLSFHVAAEKSGDGLGQLVLRVAGGDAGSGADEQHQT